MKLFHITFDWFQLVWALFHLLSGFLNFLFYGIYWKQNRIQSRQLRIFVFDNVWKFHSLLFGWNFKTISLYWKSAYFFPYVTVFLLTFHQLSKSLNIRACAKFINFLIFWISLTDVCSVKVRLVDFGEALREVVGEVSEILLRSK